MLEDISVQWAGESILDVNENGLVTIKDRGEGTLRVTAKDDGKYSAPILFKVYNACPNFKSTEYIVRIGSKEGTRLSYEEREGSRVTKMAVSGNDKFETIQHDGAHGDNPSGAKAHSGRGHQYRHGDIFTDGNTKSVLCKLRSRIPSDKRL